MKKSLGLVFIVFILFLSSCQSPDVFEPVVNQNAGQVYSQSTVIGEPGSGNGQLSQPTFVHSEEGFIYVMDSLNGRIVKFDLSGKFVKNIILTMAKTWYPFSFAFGSNGNLFALNLSTYRLYEYSKAGSLIQDHGIIDPGAGKFRVGFDLRNFKADKYGHLYAIDGMGWINKHNLNGNFLVKIGSYGSGNGQFLNPSDLVCDDSGILYVIDANRADVQVFDTNGNFIRKWGGSGVLSVPIAITIDNAGYLYIVDSLEEKVKKFRPDGEFITHWNIPQGTSKTTIRTLKGISIDENFNVYVSDGDYNIVYVFSAKQ